MDNYYTKSSAKKTIVKTLIQVFRMLFFTGVIILFVYACTVTQVNKDLLNAIDEHVILSPVNGSIDYVDGDVSRITSLEKNIDSFGTDPLVVKLQVRAEIAKGQKAEIIKWYYFNIDDPERILEVKYTPIQTTEVWFVVPKMPGEYRFAADIYTNKGSAIREPGSLLATSEGENPLGPVIIFPPSETNLDIPMSVVKVVNKRDNTVSFEVVSKIVSQKEDFPTTRMISFDFDGDGTRDLTTGNTIVEHTYSRNGTFQPRAKVTYNELASISIGERIYIQGLPEEEKVLLHTGNVEASSGTTSAIKQQIIELFPENQRTEVRDILTSIENDSYLPEKEEGIGWKEESISKTTRRAGLNQISTLGYIAFKEGIISESGMNMLYDKVCSLVKYYDIPNTTCSWPEPQQTATTTTTSSGTLTLVKDIFQKLFLILLLLSVVSFAGGVVRTKMKKTNNQKSSK